MFMHMPPRERFGYAVLGWVLLFSMGMLGARSLRQAAPVVVENKAAAPGGNQGKLVVGTQEELLVHVAGAVKKPGVYRVKPNTRVYEAVDLAGGAQAGADLNRVDLAARAVDGEQIYVPRIEEKLPTKKASPKSGQRTVDHPIEFKPIAVDVPTNVKANPIQEPPASGSKPPPPTGGTPSLEDYEAIFADKPPRRSATHSLGAKGSVRQSDVRVNLNTDGAEKIAELPGIGARMAAAIVRYRQEYGAFRSVEDLAKVPGIGAKRIAALRGLIQF